MCRTCEHSEINFVGKTSVVPIILTNEMVVNIRCDMEEAGFYTRMSAIEMYKHIKEVCLNTTSKGILGSVAIIFDMFELDMASEYRPYRYTFGREYIEDTIRSICNLKDE